MECDGCTLCCQLLPIPWENSEAGKYCIHCSPSVGCNKFEVADTKCLEFECAYCQMGKVSEKLRPDKCGVVFERVNDRIFLGTKSKETTLNDDVKRQIVSLNSEGFSVVIHSLFEKKDIYLAIGHDKNEIINEVKEVGFTVLHN